MKESKQLEFKENISNNFLKTVSAFANYGGGSIVFGIDDNGTVVGLENPKQSCLNIENAINDAIKPQVDFILTVDGTKNTVTLRVNEGRNKPYLYKLKAYKRNDTSTIEQILNNEFVRQQFHTLLYTCLSLNSNDTSLVIALWNTYGRIL